MAVLSVHGPVRASAVALGVSTCLEWCRAAGGDLRLGYIQLRRLKNQISPMVTTTMMTHTMG